MDKTTVNDLRTTNWASGYTEYLRRRLAAAEAEQADLRARLERLERLVAPRIICGKESARD